MKISVQITLIPSLSFLGEEGWGERIKKVESMGVSAYIFIQVEAEKTKSSFEALTV